MQNRQWNSKPATAAAVLGGFRPPFAAKPPGNGWELTWGQRAAKKQQQHNENSNKSAPKAPITAAAQEH